MNELLSPDVSVALLLAALLLFLFVGLMLGKARRTGTDPSASPPASTNDRLAALETRMLELEQKTNKISIEIQHLPTAETVTAMAVKIAEIGGDVKALQSSVLATNRLIERIDQWLLSTANNKGSAS